MDDQSLLNGLRNHDKTTIEYIFSKYFSMIYDHVRRNGGRQEEAEDLFMRGLEVFYLKSQDNSFALSCSFSTLLFEICKRQWLKTLRRKKRERRVTFEHQKELIDNKIFESIEKAERYELYREKFELLTKGCQEVLNLVFEGLSMKTIAEKLGFASEQYVRKRKFNCKEKLIELIKADPRYIELINYDSGRAN